MPGMKLITPISLLSALPLALAACAPPGPVSDTAPPPPAATPQGTRVLDKDAAAKLVNNAGLTLQWIGWDRRGTAYARFDGDVLRLTGRQSSEDGAGQLMRWHHRHHRYARQGPRLPRGQDMAVRGHAKPPLLATARVRMV
jgi:hypothetical protein